jgi:HlyD family secretion protein
MPRCKAHKPTCRPHAQDSQPAAGRARGPSAAARNVRLLAPADGRGDQRDAEARQHRGGRPAVLRLADPASLWVKLRVDQGRSGGLHPGLPAQHRAAL